MEKGKWKQRGRSQNKESYAMEMQYKEALKFSENMGIQF